MLYGTAGVFVVAIGVAAGFNHVIERFYIQAVFLGTVAVIGWGIAGQYPRIRMLYFSALLVCAGWLLYAEFGHKMRHTKAYRQWEEGRELCRSGVMIFCA